MSIDSVFVHKMWDDNEISKMVEGGVPFPMLSDAGGKVLDGMVERVGSTGQSHKVPGDSIDLGRVLPA